MESSPEVKAFWARCLQDLSPGETLPDAYTAWSFGSDSQTADQLARLVLRGIKTATASLVWEYEAEGEALPEVGDISIILDGSNQPLAVIETTQIQIRPFNEVSNRFAYDEGEGDRSLAYWREVHWKFFSESCAQIGRTPDERMPVLCERFRLLWPQPRSEK